MEYPSTNALLRVIIRHLTNPADEQKPSESGRPTVRLVSAKYYQAETGVNNTFLTWELRNHVVGLYLNVSAESCERPRGTITGSLAQTRRARRRKFGKIFFFPGITLTSGGLYYSPAWQCTMRLGRWGGQPSCNSYCSVSTLCHVSSCPSPVIVQEVYCNRM